MAEPGRTTRKSTQPRVEARLVARWAPVIGSKYSQALAEGKDAESLRFLLTLPFALAGVLEIKSNLAISYLILAMGFILLGVLEYFAAKRLREVGKAIVIDLKRLGLNPSSVPKLKRIPTFERWMVREGLTFSSVQAAGMLEDDPNRVSK
jgi:hypothetical protein